ncbi:MAG: hypothetical protein WAQ98_21840 [Blastocatellia bacterium]
MTKKKVKNCSKNDQKNNDQHHELARGKSRPCIRCSYKYGCCRKCDLCLKCHQEKYGSPYKLDERYYYLEAEKEAKQAARFNPGNLYPNNYLE